MTTAPFASSRPGQRIQVFGDAFAPFEPSRTSQDIAGILHECATYTDLESVLTSLSGRFIVIAAIGKENRLYPDTCGSRSVFYKHGKYCFHPGEWNLPPDRSLFKHPNLSTWPLGITPYESIWQLLPNHYLDLTTWQPVRFAPGVIEKRSPDSAAAIMRRLLRGTLEAMVKRGAVSLPLTAGYDSRTLLTAALGLPIRYFTVVDQNTALHDIEIPRRLAERLGLDWKYVDSSDGTQEDCGGLYQDANSYRIKSFAQSEYVALGHAAEICRCFYWKDGKEKEFSVDVPSELCEEVQQWASGAKTSVYWADLWYWENRVGLWSSLCCSVMEQYCKPISPYNCRALLNAGLGVEARYRSGDYELQRMLIAPELLDIPFNTTWLERLKVPWRVAQFMRMRTYRRAAKTGQ